MKDLLLGIYSQRLLISKAQFLALSDTFKAFLCQISPLWNLQSSLFHAKTQNSMHILVLHAPNWVNKRKYTYFTFDLFTLMTRIALQCPECWFVPSWEAGINVNFCANCRKKIMTADGPEPTLSQLSTDGFSSALKLVLHKLWQLWRRSNPSLSSH